MRKPLAAAIAAALAAGLAVGGVAGAAETATGAAGWVREALGGLVEDGTITQGQADAVADALEEARPPRPPGRGFGHHPHAGAEALAEALGMSPEDLRAALREGGTIADLAEERGVSTDALVEALVDTHRERLTAAVDAGRLTQEQADALLEGADERARAVIAGEAPFFRGRGRPHHHHHHHHHHPHRHGRPAPAPAPAPEAEGASA